MATSTSASLPRLRRATATPRRAMTARPPFDDVLAAAQHGSEWAWGHILTDVGPDITAYARSQGAEDPEDVLSRTLEGIVRGIARFQGAESAFRSWVFTIAHARIIDDRRRRSRRPQPSDRDVPDTADPIGDAHAASGTLSREAAMELLDGLPDKQRDVLALRLVAGLSVEQTARVLGKRPGAVRVAMHRALRTMEARNLDTDVTQ